MCPNTAEHNQPLSAPPTPSPVARPLQLSGELIQFPPGTAPADMPPPKHTPLSDTPLPQSMTIARLSPLSSSHHLSSPSHESTHPSFSIFQPELFINVSSGAEVRSEETWCREVVTEAVAPLPAVQPLPVPQDWALSIVISSGRHHSIHPLAPGTSPRRKGNSTRAAL